MSSAVRLLVLAVLFSVADRGLGDLDIREIQLTAREDGTLSPLLFDDTLEIGGQHYLQVSNKFGTISRLTFKLQSCKGDADLYVDAMPNTPSGANAHPVGEAMATAKQSLWRSRARGSVGDDVTVFVSLLHETYLVKIWAQVATKYRLHIAAGSAKTAPRTGLLVGHPVGMAFRNWGPDNYWPLRLSWPSSGPGKYTIVWGPAERNGVRDEHTGLYFFCAKQKHHFSKQKAVQLESENEAFISETITVTHRGFGGLHWRSDQVFTANVFFTPRGALSSFKRVLFDQPALFRTHYVHPLAINNALVAWMSSEAQQWSYEYEGDIPVGQTQVLAAAIPQHTDKGMTVRVRVSAPKYAHIDVYIGEHRPEGLTSAPSKSIASIVSGASETFFQVHPLADCNGNGRPPLLQQPSSILGFDAFANVRADNCQDSTSENVPRKRTYFFTVALLRVVPDGQSIRYRLSIDQSQRPSTALEEEVYLSNPVKQNDESIAAPAPSPQNSPRPRTKTNPRANSCEYANDGACDEPVLCARGTDTFDCEAASRASHPSPSPRSSNKKGSFKDEYPTLYMIGDILVTIVKVIFEIAIS